MRKVLSECTYLIEGENGGVYRRNRFQMRPTQVEFCKTSAISGLVIGTPRSLKCVPENRADEKPEQPITPLPEAHMNHLKPMSSCNPSQLVPATSAVPKGLCRSSVLHDQCQGKDCDSLRTNLLLLTSCSVYVITKLSCVVDSYGWTINFFFKIMICLG